MLPINKVKTKHDSWSTHCELERIELYDLFGVHCNGLSQTQILSCYFSVSLRRYYHIQVQTSRITMIWILAKQMFILHHTAMITQMYSIVCKTTTAKAPLSVACVVDLFCDVSIQSWSFYWGKKKRWTRHFDFKNRMKKRSEWMLINSNNLNVKLWRKRTTN